MIQATAAIQRTTRLDSPPPLRSALLSGVPFVRHGLTFRVPGMGKAEGNIGLGTPRDRKDAWEMRKLWCASIGVDPERIVTMGQVHGNDVIRVYAEDAGKGSRNPGSHVGYADALITDAPNVVLMTLHADCQPILLVDPVRRAIGAIHSGWRGTVADVGGEAVASMRTEFGSEPVDILAFLGPAIGPGENEVGDEVIEAWLAQADNLGKVAHDAVLKPGHKHHFDVPTANRLLLMRAGLSVEHIESSDICTKTQKNSWFSHRGHGPNAGREGALIAIADDES
ncbi:peptidoglycan editing factor PgeF [soil metagenome]